MGQLFQWVPDNELDWWYRIWSHDFVQEIMVTRGNWGEATHQKNDSYDKKKSFTFLPSCSCQFKKREIIEDENR